MNFDFKNVFALPVVAALGVGVLLGVVITSILPKRSAVRGGVAVSDLPERELEIQGAGRFRVLYASQAESRSVLWLDYSQSPRSVLIEWPRAGIYPVLDVQAGWTVVWINNGKVVATSKPGGERFGQLIAPSPVERAAILPDGNYEGGSSVKVWSPN
jgi:hypothetical protein